MGKAVDVEEVREMY